MKKILLALLVISVFFVTPAFCGFPGMSGLGIGLQGGWQSGLNVKIWTGGRTALQLDANWSYTGFFGGGIAYLWHLYPDTSGIKIPLYIGIKAAVWGMASEIAALMPIGICFILHNTPIDIFLQYEPGVQVIPAFVPVYAGGCVGIRFWFN